MKGKLMISFCLLMLLIGLILVPCSHATITEFRVNSYTTAYQWLPSIGMNANGNFVIAWGSFWQDGDRSGIFMKYYRLGKNRAGLVDFDGDGKTDVAVYWPGTGGWWLTNSRDGSYTYKQWGDPAENDEPISQ